MKVILLTVASSTLFTSSFLLVVANALVAASVRPSNDARLAFRGASGDVRKRSWDKISHGGATRKRIQQQQRRKQVIAVSTTSDTDNLSDHEYTPSIFPKEEEENRFIEGVLRTNFLFRDQKQKNQDFSAMVASFEKQEFEKGSFLSIQGDTENTNYLYLIFSGSCSVSIDKKVLPDPYGTTGPGGLTGELALLYGTPRAATVCAKTPVTVFRLHRNDFLYFLDDYEPSSSTASSRAEKIKRQVREIDEVLDQISGAKSRYDGKIIEQFQPSRAWLWRRWRGTIMQHAWKACLVNMGVSLAFLITLRVLNDSIFKNPITWPLGAIPDQGHPLIYRMKGLHKMWSYTMSITTLILSFYLNKAYALWRDIYVLGRKVQGRINDVSMMLACMAERDPKTGRYTDRSSSLLDDVAISCRLCHAFYWAGFIERFNVLLTPRGFSRMLSRGIMTPSQYDTLVGVHPNKCAPQHVTLMWIMSRILQGMTDGVIPNDPATRSMFMNKISDLRGTFGGIGDSLDGKIPLAYAQFVQALVDIFLVLAPFALYCELGIWSVPAVGILNIFFSGMNDLAKILLDPLDNCDRTFYKDSSVNMDVGVLIRESNSGTNRW
eukprot:CAMPEP_0201204256 /NCGR_PEP_ID=MMETSP0851-20130426/168487_1 /ASSEMBLY_ACC=CAM_ASM_000631 /TAXON_ID=183588 /ORGANISM="Pseudo-nitzschia fraudulenta, Strain WWA7" /LENGTH=604 /DNA_ID=CAMNT_0047492325 /DNA_START=89 /DNA_END=1900 /DNA_ORIENTATION=+